MLKGPPVCQDAMGTPNSIHKDTSVAMLCSHTVEAGGPVLLGSHPNNE